MSGSVYDRFRRLYSKEKGLVDDWNERSKAASGLLGTATNVLERLPVRNSCQWHPAILLQFIPGRESIMTHLI